MDMTFSNSHQLESLFILSIPIACISWTFTHEEVFKEPREFCEKRSKSARSVLESKFFYLFTCEYCFSHYITILMLTMTGFRLLFNDWRGYIVSGFSLVWIANVYMSIFGFIRTGLKKEKVITKIEEAELKKQSLTYPTEKNS